MAAGDPGSPARYYSSTAVETSLQSSIPAQSQGQSNTSFIVASISGFPTSYPYTLIVDPDTSKEEVVTVTSGSSTTLTVTRGSDSTQAVAHSAGAVVRHGVSGREFREEQAHIAARGYDIDSSILSAANQTHVHGIATGEGVVVGTDKTQTLNNKTIGANGLKFEGATDNAFDTTLNVEDPTANRTITFPNTSGTVTINDASQTLSNKTLGSNLAAGTYKITGLGDPSAAQDAATKNYVDTGVSSGVVQAAASAAAAATSAASASTSASSALTSANSASTSATAAATSATSAATSASAASTSATSASNSASAASTSATSAATSASSASTSASSALTSANSASTSASSALTSANSAATSASSAATSYDSFDDRYLGAKASPPTVDNDGNALLTGALYWNTGSNQMFVWGGSAWSEISSTAQIFRYKFTAAGGETSESGVDDNGNTLSYLVGKEQVYLNGALLVRGSDYTATNGTSISGLSPALSSGDVLEVITFSAFVLATAITNSSLEAKGDLISASTAGTLARVAVGSNDQVLVADSSASTGLAWKSVATPFAAGKNKIINGDFSIWQRGTSFSNPATLTYSSDRWMIEFNGSGATRTISQQTFTPGTAPVAGYEGSFFLRYERSVAGTSATADYVGQRIENVRTFAGETVTLSFWAKVDSGTPTLTLRLRQQFGSGGSSFVDATDATVNLSTTWTRYSATFAVPSISGKTIGTNSFLQLMFRTPVNTIQTFDFWGVQLEAGSVATAFQTATGTLAGELQAAQRYYYRATFDINASRLGTGFATTTTNGQIAFPFGTQMRIRPTALEQSGTAGDYSVAVASGTAVCNAVPTYFNAAINGAVVNFPVASGLTAGEGAMFRNVNTNAYLGWSAEL